GDWSSDVCSSDLKLLEVCQGVCVIIQIRSIKPGGITRRFKRRNAINLARYRFKPGAQSDQADGLAAKHTNLEEILRLEFLHQQIPHDVERVFAKAAVIASSVLKMGAMCFDFRRKPLVKIA